MQKIGASISETADDLANHVTILGGNKHLRGYLNTFHR